MDKQQTKNCQNCKTKFTIEPDDFVFYKKINVQLPKLCPLCRAQLRLAFRNERAFYKRGCDNCHKEVISMYSSNKPYTVWCYDCWFSDNWSSLEYGREYDSSRPFFEQFNELWSKIPKIGLMHIRSINSEYVNISADSKNCYMIIESSNNENCIHCYWIQQCNDCIDVSFAHQIELSYESDDCYNCNKLLYSKGCHDCLESSFLLNCRGCSNCIGCVNLQNKQYYIFNQPKTKKDYGEFLKSACMDSYKGVEEMRKKFSEFTKTQLKRFSEIYKSVNSTGNYIKNAKNCHSCFHCYDAEDSKYGVHIWRNAKDCMDCDTAGRNAELIYNTINAGMDVSHYICSGVCWTCSFMEYSYYCFNSNHCFGCVGLRKKDYCILNKQYDKESFKNLRNKIINDMNDRGEYGEFFPAFISTFGYNETAAQEQFPLTKEKALRKGFKWEDHSRGTFNQETISWDDISDSINELGDLDIKKEVFSCIKCKKNYRIIPSEFLFYKNLQIPLPRLCPDCRHSRRFKARGPNRLWSRKCQCAGEQSDNKIYQNTVAHFHKNDHCPNEFQTTYGPDRKEIIYCEACYQQEVI